MNIHDFESVKVKKHKGFCKFHLNISKFGTRREKWELVGVGGGGLEHFFHAGAADNSCECRGTLTKRGEYA